MRAAEPVAQLDALQRCERPAGLGATVVPGGTVFAVFSRHAERLLLCLFDERGERETARLPFPSREGDVHFGFLPGAGAGLRYGLRAEGPFAPREGHRFDPAKLLVDPYATALDRAFRWDPVLAAPPDRATDTAGLVPRCIVVSTGEPVEPPAPATPRLIYELAVKSFSMRHPGVPERLRGTLPALCEDAVIDHLLRLGVSHVELMPIAAWMDERHLPPLGLANAWGYNPVNFFAPDPRLMPGGVADLERLCARYAKAGIGVILDVVLNHTAESDEFGATICLRGLDNAVYYRHREDGTPVNDTGCGNTLALHRAPVMRMAMDALRHWRACGVAGFRFDLGTVLGRDDEGFSPGAPFLAALGQDPALAEALLIAEPWDIGPDGYRLGEFPAPFAEWNGRYRDDVRSFWRGDGGMAGPLATRLAGSADLFAPGHRDARASVNFLAAHDGFTVSDVVSYERKHNEANGEDNRDGDSHGPSWNNGVEGPSDDPVINAARARDLRALLATLFVSRGVPMIQAGDEFGRTQHGNNNAYCQDNAAFWLDWSLADGTLVDIVAALSRLRAAEPALNALAHFSGKPLPGAALPDVSWLGLDGEPLGPGDWNGLDAFAMRIAPAEGRPLLVAINRAWEPVRFTLPSGAWDLLWCSAERIDTARALMPLRSVRIHAHSRD